MENEFNRLKAEADKFPMPEECEENDRAVRFLALETGVGHFDNLNLLIMSVLFIFVSVAFLAVNSGKIINNDEELTLNRKTFLSGEFTQKLEERYLRDLPIPEEMKTAREYAALLYGIGNKVTEKNSGNYNTRPDSQPDYEHNAFESDDDDNGVSENKVTTKAAKTDKNGNTVTEPEEAETAPGGGTTAVSRPSSTVSTFSYTTEPEEEDTVTLNNDAPSVTTTTTVISKRTVTTSESTDYTETQPTESDITDSSVSDTDPPDTETSETEPVITEPPVTDVPAE